MNTEKYQPQVGDTVRIVLEGKVEAVWDDWFDIGTLSDGNCIKPSAAQVASIEKVTPTPPSSWLGIAEAAEHLGVHHRTIRRRIADGSITAHRFGSRLIRIDPAELDRLLAPMER